jgi:divalent metal cation (Fe/Co/Zn/Cd) transporter
VHAGHSEIGDDWKRFVPVVVLAVAIALEGMSFRTAIRETDKIRGRASYPEFIRRAKQPELPVILLEDFAALVGLGFAFLGVTLMLITGNQYFDAAGTALIGVLLVLVAVALAVETKSLLLGESASEDVQRRILDALTGTDGVERVIHLKTMHLGPDELLVAAKIAVPAADTAAQVADAINAAESAVRESEPSARMIYLEPEISDGA